METEGLLGGSVVYNADLFSEATIRILVGRYQTLLEAIVARSVWSDLLVLEAQELDELFA